VTRQAYNHQQTRRIKKEERAQGNSQLRSEPDRRACRGETVAKGPVSADEYAIILRGGYCSSLSVDLIHHRPRASVFFHLPFPRLFAGFTIDRAISLTAAPAPPVSPLPSPPLLGLLIQSLMPHQLRPSSRPLLPALFTPPSPSPPPLSNGHGSWYGYNPRPDFTFLSGLCPRFALSSALSLGFPSFVFQVPCLRDEWKEALLQKEVKLVIGLGSKEKFR
jgi:hypothetical protein